jgi:hypothetical protein
VGQDTGKWRENVENERQTLYDQEYGKKLEKREKQEMHTEEPRIWREN